MCDCLGDCSAAQPQLPKRRVRIICAHIHRALLVSLSLYRDILFYTHMSSERWQVRTALWGLRQHRLHGLLYLVGVHFSDDRVWCVPRVGLLSMHGAWQEDNSGISHSTLPMPMSCMHARDRGLQPSLGDDHRPAAVCPPSQPVVLLFCATLSTLPRQAEDVRSSP